MYNLYELSWIPIIGISGRYPAPPRPAAHRKGGGQPVYETSVNLPHRRRRSLTLRRKNSLLAFRRVTKIRLIFIIFCVRKRRPFLHEKLLQYLYYSNLESPRFQLNLYKTVLNRRPSVIRQCFTCFNNRNSHLYEFKPSNLAKLYSLNQFFTTSRN